MSEIIDFIYAVKITRISEVLGILKYSAHIEIEYRSSRCRYMKF